MMKLFYKAGACSLAPHIILSELNMIYEVEAVDLKSKNCPSGDFTKINPNGSVPALMLGNGAVLTEGAVIMQYLADQKPEAGLMPAAGTMERYRCLEWLNFIATDLHKNFSPLFFSRMVVSHPEGEAQLKAFYQGVLQKKIAIASERLGQKPYVLGDSFSIADAYLFTVLGWSKFVGVDLSATPNIEHYLKRVAERPGVQKAMKEEGLI